MNIFIKIEGCVWPLCILTGACNWYLIKALKHLDVFEPVVLINLKLVQIYVSLKAKKDLEGSRLDLLEVFYVMPRECWPLKSRSIRELLRRPSRLSEPHSFIHLFFQLFKYPLEKEGQVGGPILAQEEFKTIFGSIPDIYEVHTRIKVGNNLSRTLSKGWTMTEGKVFDWCMCFDRRIWSGWWWTGLKRRASETLSWNMWAWWSFELDSSSTELISQSKASQWQLCDLSFFLKLSLSLKTWWRRTRHLSTSLRWAKRP